MRGWLESHSSTLSPISPLSCRTSLTRMRRALPLLPGSKFLRIVLSSCLWLLSSGWLGHLEGLTILTEQTGLTDTNDLGGIWPNNTYLLWLAAIFVSPYLWAITVGWARDWSELRPWPPLSRERILYWEQSHKYFTAEQTLNHKFLSVVASKGSCKLTLFLPIEQHQLGRLWSFCYWRFDLCGPPCLVQGKLGLQRKEFPVWINHYCPL